MTRDTLASLPGMACAEITMMSSSLTFTHLCSCAAMSDRALSGSPCEPVQMMQISPGANRDASSMSTTRPAGTILHTGDFKLEGSDAPALAVGHGNELRAVEHPRFLDAAPGKAERELRPVDRDGDIAKEIRDPAGV